MPLSLSLFNKFHFKSDSYYLLLAALVFLLVLPKFLSSPVCSPPNVLYDKILGKILLCLYLDLAGKLIPFPKGICHSP